MGYKVERVEAGVTTITPELYHGGMPEIMAFVRPPCNGSCIVTVSVDGLTIIAAEIKRGKSFAERVAKFMLKGCLSRLGLHRRMTANRRARKAGDGAPAAEPEKEDAD